MEEEKQKKFEEAQKKLNSAFVNRNQDLFKKFDLTAKKRQTFEDKLKNRIHHQISMDKEMEKAKEKVDAM